MTKFFALCVALLSFWAAAPARAQVEASQGSFVGYQYPGVGFGKNCSPGCTGASVSLVVPTFTGSGVVYGWLGVNSQSGISGVCSVGGCLGQFGIKWTGSSLQWFYELVCSSGSGCGAAIQITGIAAPAAGDTVNLTALCTSVCTGTNSDQWAITINDATQGTTCFVIATGNHCGSSGNTMNWVLANQVQLFAVYEIDGTTTWARGAWADFTYTIGLPGSQTTANVQLAPLMASWTPGTGAGASKTSSPSAPLGRLGNDFITCSPITSGSFNACAAGPYGGAVVAIGQ